jgi:hypothetical protein
LIKNAYNNISLNYYLEKEVMIMADKNKNKDKKQEREKRNVNLSHAKIRKIIRLKKVD